MQRMPLAHYSMYVNISNLRHDVIGLVAAHDNLQ